MRSKRIAVVGGGVAGLSAAWLLSRRYEVTLFEANDYVGGHTHTVDVPGPEGQPMPVDTGFIVYNERNYPNLTGLFQHLGVATRESDMSFSFMAADSSLEWAGDNLNTLFAQRRNLLNPRFIGMILDILRFNRAGKRFLGGQISDEMTLGEFLKGIKVGDAIRQRYLLPMAAAIWSCPPQEMLDFPARRFLQFFHNHGLIDLSNRPQWRTVTNGGREYVRRMLPAVSGGYHVSSPVRRVQRSEDGIHLMNDSGHMGRFDEVVIASHADQALEMLEQPSFWERTLLSSIPYQRNEAWLHTDASLMPKRRRVWASWNYLGSADNRPASVTYWMNRLQAVPGDQDWFVTLNPARPPSADLVNRHMTYDHPLFNQASTRAQAMLGQIQGNDRIWFCGSYFGYGFHEDALRSAVDVAQKLGVNAPWNQAATSVANTAEPVPPDTASTQWQTG